MNKQIEELALRVAQDFISNRNTEKAFIADGWIPVLMREFLEELAKQSEPVGYADVGDLRGVANGNSGYIHPEDQGRMVALFTHPIPQPDLLQEVAIWKKLQADTNSQWNDKYDGLREVKDCLITERDELRNQLSAAQAELADTESDIDTLAQHNIELQADNEQLMKALEEFFERRSHDSYSCGLLVDDGLKIIAAHKARQGKEQQ